MTARAELGNVTEKSKRKIYEWRALTERNQRAGVEQFVRARAQSAELGAQISDMIVLVSERRLIYCSWFIHRVLVYIHMRKRVIRSTLTCMSITFKLLNMI